MNKRVINYEAPAVEVLAVQVEKGFALSGQTPSWGDGDAEQTSMVDFDNF